MILVTLYLAAIVAANLLVVQFGPSMSIINAFVFIGLDLTTRDMLHEQWRGRGLWWRMLALVATGSTLSYALNSGAGPIALASFVAFAGAGLADAAVYTGLGERSRFVRINGSNVVAAAVDSVLFPAIAFGFPLLIPIMVGQFVAKTAGGFVWSVILSRLGNNKLQARP